MLTLSDPQLIKEVLLNKNGFNSKSDEQVRSLTALLGKGLVSTVGEEWSLHRRIVSPAFHHDRIKVKNWLYTFLSPIIQLIIVNYKSTSTLSGDEYLKA